MNLAHQLLRKIGDQRKRIVVIGDRMIDRYVHGRTAPCQDDCIKFVQEEVVEVPGGAANAERSINKWCGAPTWLYSYAQNECPIKTRYFDANNKIIYRVDDEGPSNRSAVNWLAREMALEAVATAGAVLLSDYDKGFLTPEFIRSVADLCNQRGIPCVADCKRSPELYRGCVLKGNADWQYKHNQVLGDIVYDVEHGRRLVVTAGMDNPVVWDGDGPLGLGYNLQCVKCVNHIGAGDCFAAHLTLALAYKFSLREAAAIAHSAGRVYVQFQHNRPPEPSEIEADLYSAISR